MSDFLVNQLVELPITFRNEAGSLADPTTVTLTVRSPAGAVTTYTYGPDGEIAKDATGVYRGLIIPTAAGDWFYEWTTTGDPQVKVDGTFDARLSFTASGLTVGYGYCTLDDVRARNPARQLSPSTVPNLVDVIGFISQTAAELDGILKAKGYTTPIATSATQAFQLLRNYNALGAACLVEQSAITGAGKRTDICSMWDHAKSMLAAGTMELDAAKDTTSSMPRGGRSGDGGFPATAIFRLDSQF